MEIQILSFGKMFVSILKSTLFAFLLAGCALTSANHLASEKDALKIQALSYRENMDGPAPLLSDERDLQTITAVPYLKVTDQEGAFLEGTVFDREGNLYFVNAHNGTIYKVTPDKTLSIAFVAPKGIHPASLKFNQAGRMFIASLGDFINRGSVISCNPDGSDIEVIVDESAGLVVDELIFDNKGGIYIADYKGTPYNPVGGVYYVAPDGKKITPVLTNMALANGLVLGADQKTLFVTEMGMGRLHRVDLLPDGVSIAPFGANIPYYFNGTPGPDSATIDSDDNVYVAMFKQGRLLVFNKNGYPIGQILIPGRKTGHNLMTTHAAFIPGTDTLIVCTADESGENGAWLYIAKGFAKGAREYHLQ